MNAFLLACAAWWGLAPSEPPPLADLERFPPGAVVEANREWSWRHQAWLEKQIELDLVYGDWWRQRLWDARAAFAAWDLLDDCQRSEGDNRRENLRRLRSVLSASDWNAGRLPPVCPDPSWFLLR